MTRAGFALVVLAGCGRIAFAPVDDASVGATDATSDAAISPGVVLWLAFEDDLTDGADDSSGGDHHALCFTACPLQAVGRHGNAASFDGMGASYDARPTMPVDNYTWSLWVNLRVQQPFSALVSNASVGIAQPGGAEMALQTGAFEIWTNGIRQTTGTSVTVGTWAHLAFTRVGSALTMFVDGTQVQTGGEVNVHDFATCQLLIGVDTDMGCTGLLNGYLDAVLDEIRIYSRALTPVEIAADMASATPVAP